MSVRRCGKFESLSWSKGGTIKNGLVRSKTELKHLLSRNLSKFLGSRFSRQPAARQVVSVASRRSVIQHNLKNGCFCQYFFGFPTRAGSPCASSYPRLSSAGVQCSFFSDMKNLRVHCSLHGQVIRRFLLLISFLRLRCLR